MTLAYQRRQKRMREWGCDGCRYCVRSRALVAVPITRLVMCNGNLLGAVVQASRPKLREAFEEVHYWGRIPGERHLPSGKRCGSLYMSVVYYVYMSDTYIVSVLWSWRYGCC